MNSCFCPVLLDGGSERARCGLCESSRALRLLSIYSVGTDVCVQPVGAGCSYDLQSSLRNSSERAAWDLDDLLHAFWA